MSEFEELRQKIRALDDQLVTILGKRLELARKVGQLKTDLTSPIRNFEVESHVLAQNRQLAEKENVPLDLVEPLTHLLFRSSCQAQEEVQATKHPKMVFIYGARGGMGTWFTQFFKRVGHEVIESDLGDKNDSLVKSADVIILATPMEVTPHLIYQLIEKKPQGLIFDICSVKTPLIDPIRKALDEGLKITSVHPLFGPQTTTLFENNLLFCYHPNQTELCKEAKNLFLSTAANLIEMPIEEHDPLICYISALTQTCNFLFTALLEESGNDYSYFEKWQSTSFKTQSALAKRLLKGGTPDLYYEILEKNPFALKMLQNFETLIKDYKKMIERKQEKNFTSLIERCKSYLK